MNKYTVLIIIISILSIALICLGVYVAITPTIVPPKPEPVVITYPTNELAAKIEIERPDYERVRLLAIRNFTEKTNRMLGSEIFNNIDRLRYYMLDAKGEDHMLIVPFETGGTITLRKVIWDERGERYRVDEENIIFEDTVEENYALLLKCDRSIAEPTFEVKLTQGDQTATYWIQSPKDGTDIKTLEFVPVDIAQETDAKTYQLPVNSLPEPEINGEKPVEGSNEEV